MIHLLHASNWILDGTLSVFMRSSMHEILRELMPIPLLICPW